MFKDEFGTEWKVGDKGVGELVFDYVYKAEIEIVTNQLSGGDKLYVLLISNGSDKPSIESTEMLNHIRFEKISK